MSPINDTEWDVLEVLWPRQRFEHLDRGHDVVVDDRALAGAQRAVGNVEVK